MYKVGDIVRFAQGGELGVVFDRAASQSEAARTWGRLVGGTVYRYKVAPLDQPLGKPNAYYTVLGPGLRDVLDSERTSELERKAQAALKLHTGNLQRHKEALAANKQHRVHAASQIIGTQHIKPGDRVLVRGPKKSGNWEGRVVRVDHKKGRVYLDKAMKWVPATVIIRTLEAVESELPCELSENTLDQLQDQGWAQFQVGRDFNRKGYIVAFTRDAAADKGDKPSPEVFKDPSLGLYWRPAEV